MVGTKRVFRWNELHRLAEESPSRKLHDKHELPEGVEQDVETEQHIEDDGTIVTTTTMTSHYTETRSGTLPPGTDKQPLAPWNSKNCPRLTWSFSESPVEKTYEDEALQG